MKKIFALLLVGMMIFSLAACGDNNTTDPDKDNPGVSQSGENNDGGENNNGTQGGTQGGAASGDVGSMISGIGSSTALYSDMDAASKQAFIAEGARQGLDISFGADGSTTIVNTTDGTTLIQKPDGNWVFSDGQGGEGQIGGNWPDNDLAKLVPAANFTISASTYYDGNCAISFSGVTLDQIKAYVEQVKSAGFDNDVTLTDNAGYYSYQAYDDAGNSAQVFFTAGIGGLNMRAADPYDE